MMHSCYNSNNNACYFHHTHKKCVQTNPWITFLLDHREILDKKGIAPQGAGGRYTRAQLKSGYTAYKAQLAARPRNKCLNTFRQARGDNRNATDVNDICLSMFDQNHSFQFPSAWKRALRLTKQRTGLTSNFDAHMLTVQHLNAIMNVLDEVFMRGTLVKNLTRLGKKPYFEISEQPCEYYPCALMVTHCNNRMILYRLMFLSAHAAILDGVKLYSRLEQLVHTIAHELVHCIVFTACPSGYEEAMHNHNGHGLPFRQLNHRIFGHSPNAYQYRNVLDTRCNVDMTANA